MKNAKIKNVCGYFMHTGIGLFGVMILAVFMKDLSMQFICCVAGTFAVGVWSGAELQRTVRDEF